MSDARTDKIIDRFVRAIKAPSYALSLKRVRTLLAEGLDASVRTADGFSPLHQAAQEGDPKICRLLINKGASVHAADGNRNTPLHFAAAISRVEACRILIDAGADLHALDCHGETPLHAAAKWSFEVFEMMVNAGGDPGFMPENAPASYLTPFQLAVKSGMVDVGPKVVRYAIEHCNQCPNQLAADGRTLDELAGDVLDVLSEIHSARTDRAVRIGFGNAASDTPGQRRQWNAVI